MTMYDKLKFTLANHMYKRGEFKGDAPADTSRRSRNHIRIVSHSDRMCIKMHSTSIITAYPSGGILIDVRNWGNSPTTKEALNDALGKYWRGPRIYLGSKSVFSLSQLCLFVGDKTYRYYDGMMLDGGGVLTSPPKPFHALRMDKDQSTALAEGVKTSGFKDMFPLLYATAAPTEQRVYRTTSNLRAALIDADKSHEWPELIANYKYTATWGWHGGVHRRSPVERGDAKSCWSTIMTEAKLGMTRAVASTTTEILHGITPTFSPSLESSI